MAETRGGKSPTAAAAFAKSSAGRPLPLPPTPRAYPQTYGPSSTIKRSSPSLPPLPQNSHEAFNYGQSQSPFPFGGGRGGESGPSDWFTDLGGNEQMEGSTFFVGNGGTLRGNAARRMPLPQIPTQVQTPKQQQQTLPFQSTSLTMNTRPPLQPLPYANSPPRMQAHLPTATPPSKLPLGNSSIMVHSGFWNILAATGSRFAPAVPTAPPFTPDGLKDNMDFGFLGVTSGGQPAVVGGVSSAGRRGVTSPTLIGADPEINKKRYVSKGMISKPRNFQHVLHASDADQAEALLNQWQRDGVGKLADPAWSEPIKEASRARARAKAIAEVQANRDIGSLKVANGLPSFLSTATTISTTSAVEDYRDLERVDEGDAEDEPLSPPAFPGMGARTNTAQTFVIKEEEETWNQGTVRATRPRARVDGLPTGVEATLSSIDSRESFKTNEQEELDPFGAPTNFLPSLTTIEKAVATKIYFETHYHAILKKPRDRDRRRILLEKELGRLHISDLEKQNVRGAFALSETEYLRDIRTRVDVTSFVKLKTIGHGAFGVVSLCKEKGSGELYAMKQLRKADMLRKGQEGHVRAERNLLAAAATGTRWTVRLAYSFQDTDNLFLVMAFMGGGDLLTLLIEKDTFKEDMARFYLAEMLLALEETHKVLGAIHRDVKPDNFLFDSAGHIKISDFGLATDFHWEHDGAYYESQRRNLLQKHGIDLDDHQQAPPTTRFDQERVRVTVEAELPGSILTMRDKGRKKLAYSVVGTNNYMAVEVLRGTGYDQASDFWSLGVIAFEMLYGYPPFISKSRQQTRQKILSWRSSLRFPAKPRISREAQHFIASLLCEKEDRLGSQGVASVARPNSIIQRQRSGFLNGTVRGMGAMNLGLIDGAQEIKAHPFFRGIDFETIHLQNPPFVPQLASADDTKYFEEDIDANPLPAPDGADPNATRDPLLGDSVQGEHLLDVRKSLAFQGWTYRKPRNVYDPQRGIPKMTPVGVQAGATRGRSGSRVEGGSAFVRSLSV